MSTAAVKRWEQAVREYGFAVPGSGWPELHHVAGRTYKQNKVLIGPWFILLLPAQFHNPTWGDPDNVTNYRHSFTARFGNQRDLFQNMVDHMQGIGVDVPAPEILEAIRSTKY